MGGGGLINRSSLSPAHSPEHNIPVKADMSPTEVTLVNKLDTLEKNLKDMNETVRKLEKWIEYKN